MKTYKTGAEMLAELNNHDLYCEEKGIYVFLYNDAGSIAYYNLSPTEARAIQAQAKESDEYWGAFLGPGGYIIDDPTYENFTQGSQTNLEWCEEHKDLHWVPCEEY